MSRFEVGAHTVKCSFVVENEEMWCPADKQDGHHIDVYRSIEGKVPMSAEGVILAPVQRQRPISVFTSLSTFTGLGGMDLGLEAAGFKNLAAVEWDESARRSIVANRCGWNLLRDGDIAEVADSLCPRDLGVARGDLDLLVGAPPCQPYSKAAQWAPGSRRGLDDRRGQYLDDFLKLLDSFRPKVALIENVRGFVGGTTSALPYITSVLSGLAMVGSKYRVEHRVLDAADFGVPQRRHRAIVVITRLDRPFVWPAPGGPSTAWDAIGSQAFDEVAPSAVGKWASLLASIPEGENYLWHTRRGGGESLFGYRTRYWSFLLKLAKDAPSWTLPAQPGPSTGPFHWDNRPLRVQEILRLQSFPADWIVEGSSRLERVRQVGNATPPLLAEAVGLAVIAHLKGAQQVMAPSKFLIESQGRIPPPKLPSPVPAEFRGLVGKYADHPGKGRGPGATRSARLFDTKSV